MVSSKMNVANQKGVFLLLHIADAGELTVISGDSSRETIIAPRRSDRSRPKLQRMKSAMLEELLV